MATRERTDLDPAPTGAKYQPSQLPDDATLQPTYTSFRDYHHPHHQDLASRLRYSPAQAYNYYQTTFTPYPPPPPILQQTPFDLDLAFSHAIIGSLLPPNWLLLICSMVSELFVAEPNMIEIDIRHEIFPQTEQSNLCVVGDIHGQFYDLIEIFKRNSLPPLRRYLFLGDYVDRGNCSIETITLLFVLKLKFPQHIHLLKGNHESELSAIYGFKHELSTKYPIEVISPKLDRTVVSKLHNTSLMGKPSDPKLGPPHCVFLPQICQVKPFATSTLYRMFLYTFETLPIAAIVKYDGQNQCFCVHGGLSPGLRSLSSINNLYRFLDVEDTINPIVDMLWSDPTYEMNDFHKNRRGCGYVFGKRAWTSFLRENELDTIIRSHELAFYGLHILDECVITVWSSPNYVRRYNNRACVLILRSNKYDELNKEHEDAHDVQFHEQSALISSNSNVGQRALPPLSSEDVEMAIEHINQSQQPQHAMDDDSSPSPSTSHPTEPHFSTATLFHQDTSSSHQHQHNPSSLSSLTIHPLSQSNNNTLFSSSSLPISPTQYFHFDETRMDEHNTLFPIYTHIPPHPYYIFALESNEDIDIDVTQYSNIKQQQQQKKEQQRNKVHSFTASQLNQHHSAADIAVDPSHQPTHRNSTSSTNLLLYDHHSHHHSSDDDFEGSYTPIVLSTQLSINSSPAISEISAMLSNTNDTDSCTTAPHGQSSTPTTYTATMTQRDDLQRAQQLLYHIVDIQPFPDKLSVKFMTITSKLKDIMFKSIYNELYNPQQHHNDPTLSITSAYFGTPSIPDSPTLTSKNLDAHPSHRTQRSASHASTLSSETDRDPSLGPTPMSPLQLSSPTTSASPHVISP